MDLRPGSIRSLPPPINKALLSPDDAVTIHAQQLFDSDDLFRLGVNTRFYEQIKAESRLAKSTSSTPEPLVSRIPGTPRSSRSTPRTSESRSRPSSIFGRPKRRKSIIKESRIDFRRLPYPVFQCILDQLHLLHNERLSPTCSTCFMRDLAAMQLACSAWDADTRKRLYEHIDISGSDSREQLHKYRLQRGSRLKLLRRTLRERKLLASLVKTLNVQDPNLPLYLPDGQPNPEFNDYRDLVASIVMLCPNLERLTGFYTIYNHEFERLTHALSTRKNLEEHAWIIGENDDITARCEKQLPPGLIDKHQRYQFLHYHKAWARLEFLMLCSPGGAGIIEHGIFAEMLSSLPSLKHLCVSSFDTDDFTDATLGFLPDLVSLRIEECSGVTETGLARWSASPSAYRLRTLSLIHQNVKDLTKISKILSSLGLLQKFVIIQSDVSPKVPQNEIVFQPLIASPSLEELHWDIAPENVDLENPMSILQSQELLERRLPKVQGETLTPNAHLALSILHSGFPRLKTLRAPQDIAPPGILQAVCRPSRNRNVLLPSDRFATRPKAAVFQTDVPQSNSLRAARLRAQGYIDGNIREAQEFIRVVVTDHSDLPDESADNTSCSNSFASSAETNITEADEVFSPDDNSLPSGTENGPSRSSTKTPHTSTPTVTAPSSIIELECPWSESLLTNNHSGLATLQTLPPQVPIRSPMRRAVTVPVKIQEFSLPSFIGRVVTTGSKTAQPPRFNLRPDMPGRDGNGGVLGWGDLLRVSEKIKSSGSCGDGNGVVAVGTGEAFVRDGCTGAWNRDAPGKGTQWWRHVARERTRQEGRVNMEHFF
jgi:hypothetical protein